MRLISKATPHNTVRTFAAEHVVTAKTDLWSCFQQLNAEKEFGDMTGVDVITRNLA